MSAKEIREAAEFIRARASEPHNSCPVYGLYLRMVREIEAIERAAGQVRVWGIGPVVLPPSSTASTASTEYRNECEQRRLDAYDVLARVAAKEAP